MKKLVLILTVVFAALSMQSCSATFHASHRHPVPPGPVVHVDVRPGHHPKVRRHVRRYRKYVRNTRNYRRNYRDYGMRPDTPVPPRNPVPPRKPVPPRRPRH